MGTIDSSIVFPVMPLTVSTSRLDCISLVFASTRISTQYPFKLLIDSVEELRRRFRRLLTFDHHNYLLTASDHTNHSLQLDTGSNLCVPSLRSLILERISPGEGTRDEAPVQEQVHRAAALPVSLLHQLSYDHATARGHSCELILPTCGIEGS